MTPPSEPHSSLISVGSSLPPDVGGQGQRKSGQLCLVLVRPDRQTPDRVFLKIRTKSGHRTESRQTESGQTDIGQDFLQNSGQNPDSGQNRDRQNPDRQTPDRESGQNPDTGQTPDRSVRKIPTTDSHWIDSRVRRKRLSAVCPHLCPCPGYV